MPKIISFRDLIVWQKGIDLAVRCYKRVRRFPREDQMTLGREIRKSAISIPSNISEGQARKHTAVYMNHLWIANGSGAELQTQFEIARRVELVTEEEAAAYIADAQEIGRMLGGLVNSLERGGHV
jgi:four helix bundle protein